MELNINVTTMDNCKIVITDTSNYLAEDFSGTVKGKFKYSDTVSIDVLQHNKNTEIVYKNPIYTKHDNINSINIPVEFDGWFNIIHLVLPTYEWFDREVSKSEGSALGLYDLIYFSDGINVYKYIEGKVSQINIKEILELDSINNTTISKYVKESVSICFLRKCYVNLCQQIFNSKGFSNCQDRSKIDSELVYKRDLVWMAINVIKYLTECEQLAEVNRIIETIQGCNGVCTPNTLIDNSDDCGCS